MYKKQPVQSYEINGGTIAYRVFGEGEPLVFIHGFPTHGYTWRKQLPDLSQNHQCIVIDLPGLGDSDWTDNCDFSSKAQGIRVIKLLEQLGIKKCGIVSHDSGATIARYIAIEKRDLVSHLIMMNTEIPNHRPPWIPFYQQISRIPLVPSIIRQTLKSKFFLKSPMGFRELYSDKKLLSNPEYLNPYVEPVIASNKKTGGAFKFLRGIDWKLVDDFESLHKSIKAETLFLWGEDDKTFPIEIGKRMVQQFNDNCTFITIKSASLLPHEEQADEINKLTIKFLEPVSITKNV